MKSELAELEEKAAFSLVRHVSAVGWMVLFRRMKNQMAQGVMCVWVPTANMELFPYYIDRWTNKIFLCFFQNIQNTARSLDTA